MGFSAYLSSWRPLPGWDSGLHLFGVSALIPVESAGNRGFWSAWGREGFVSEHLARPSWAWWFRKTWETGLVGCFFLISRLVLVCSPPALLYWGRICCWLNSAQYLQICWRIPCSGLVTLKMSCSEQLGKLWRVKGRKGKDGGVTLAFHWGRDYMLPVRPEAANCTFQVGGQIELWRGWHC